MAQGGPMVGLLYNPAVPLVLDEIGSRVDYVEVIPDRLWYDFGQSERDRFSYAQKAVDELRRYAENREVLGHGIGLSLPSAIPLDLGLVDKVVESHRDLKYKWYSEHLSMFLVPDGSVPNAQAGMGLPVVFDEETFDIVSSKVRRLSEALDRSILLENGTIFSQIPDQDMSEPEFFNRLNKECGCGMLLDLHNLYANTINLGISAEEYLGQLDPNIIVEFHLAGGDMLGEHYTDSHSRPTPSKVWEWAHEWAPKFPNLAAITYEYHESYHKRLGVSGVAHEIDLMQELSAKVASARRDNPK
jgi:uncharacterized protein